MIKRMPAGAVIALCLIVIIGIVIILIASITFRSNIEESYADLQKQSLFNLSQNILGYINMKHTQFEELDFDSLDADTLQGMEYSAYFEGIARIDGGGNIRLIYNGRLYQDNSLNATNIKSEFIERNTLNVFTLSQLLPQSLPGSEKVFAFKKEAGENTFLVLSSFENLNDVIGAYSFNEIMIITRGGIILYSREGIKKSFVYEDIPTRVWDDIKTADNTQTPILENTSFFGEDGLLAYISVQTPLYFQEWRMLSFTRADTMKSLIARNMQAFYITCFLLFAAMLAGVGIYAYYYKTRYDERFKAIGLDEKTLPFILTIDEWGNIIKSNDSFRRLSGAENIFNHLVDFGIKAKKIIDNALSFTVRLNDYDGNERYINFSVIKGHKYNKAIGNDSTEQMQDYFSKVESYRRDYYTDLLNTKALKRDFDFLTPEGECLYIQITVPSIKQYVISFGETFARKIRRSFANRLQKVFKDNRMLYYIGDSNYAVIIEGTKEVNNFSVNINDFLRPLTQPIKVDDNQVSLQIKMGIAEFNGKENFKTLGALWLEAEAAIQSITSTGKVYAYYKDALAVYGDAYFDNRKTLERIVFSPDIALYYQPQYNIEGEIVGLEGLCRVENHALRDITTDRFIALVEKNGLIVDLSRILYEKAFELAYAIRDKNIVLSLNVSPIQLLQTGFISDFLSLLRKYSLPHRSVCLEITENVLMEDYEEVVKKLQILRKNGILIQLDDFGISYSSLLYLKEFPIDGIKIDRSFITDVVTNEYSRTIVEKIVGIATSLHLSCVIEGVESKEQLDCLTSMGDVTIQGWYYSKAQPMDKIGTLLGYDDIESIIAEQRKERESAMVLSEEAEDNKGE
ncbi:MAG: EAL domain-containing protein [Christensenellales bacterium]